MSNLSCMNMYRAKGSLWAIRASPQWEVGAKYLTDSIVFFWSWPVDSVNFCLLLASLAFSEKTDFIRTLYHMKSVAVILALQSNMLIIWARTYSKLDGFERLRWNSS